MTCIQKEDWRPILTKTLASLLVHDYKEPAAINLIPRNDPMTSEVEEKLAGSLSEGDARISPGMLHTG
jgi:hypothetical protein